jgi:hypothetical protein
MTEHFSRSTVSSAFWCGKCQKQTQHRIDGVRKGPCLECIARYDAAPKVEAPEKVQEQQSLFERGAA